MKHLMSSLLTSGLVCALLSAPASGQSSPWAGLWVGFVSIDKVNQSPRTCLPEICDELQPAFLSDTEPENDNDCPEDGFCRLPCESEEIDGGTCPDYSGDIGYRRGPGCRPRQLCPQADEPVTTGVAFDFRLIVHVDATGQPRLLKEVIQLYREPVYGPDPETPEFQTIIEPGDLVLVTDDALIPEFSGVALRDGQPVGLRIATAAYDFEPSSMEMDGIFGAEGSLQILLTLDRNFPTNPFRHKFHPDHNNLAPAPSVATVDDEAPDLERQMHFELNSDFSVVNLFGTNIAEPPDWGANSVGGTYRETISGLVRPLPPEDTPIIASGTFLLRRVAATETLNGQ